LYAGLIHAQDTPPAYSIYKVDKPPRIDGYLDDESWKDVTPVSKFYQYLPIEGSEPQQKTEVRIAYDNSAIYVGAMMYDSAPDSILKELSARDALDDVNSDYFRIAIDPYNKNLDAWFFGVYASGVQFDYKESDNTYDGVWESSVRITEEGWIAEMRIPFSAFRFPKDSEQQWTMQLNRYIRRSREFIQWAKTPGKANNPLNYWGKLTGINDIKAPLRLSLTPYFSTYLENAPVYNSSGSVTYGNSFSYNIGADIKYGIDERFTIDMTLFPDFGQVQSDNKVKNLSYQEVTYAENRSFFKESVELFDKDNLFYSRRIGKTPDGYYSAASNLNEGEELAENPSSVKLLHAIKLSGRTDGGLGVGVFNAVTDNTYAVARDSAGNERRFLTEPLTNYNVMVFDQQLKNNSEVYFINTNVIREGGFTDANVSGTGFSLSNSKNTFAVEGSGSLSQRFTTLPEGTNGTANDLIGYKYSLVARKLGGTFNYAVARTAYDDKYYTSDLGYQAINNKVVYEFYVAHNVTQPWKFLRNSYNNTGYTYAHHFESGKPVVNDIYVNLFGTFMNYLSAFAGFGFTPGPYYDYFEPRVEGRYQKGMQYFYFYTGLSSDYRKRVALDLNLNLSNFTDRFVSEGYNLSWKLRFRANDKLTLRWNFTYSFDPYNLGFVDIDPQDNIIYGLRYRNTYINQVTVSYIFRNDMYISLNARHYWSTAEYRKYLTLLQNGELEDNYVYSVNNNFNYNAFNIDFLYSWEFAPGSNLSIVYKNAIENDMTNIISFPGYGENLKGVLNDPQTNSVSVKVLYYLDYHYVRKKVAGQQRVK